MSCFIPVLSLTEAQSEVGGDQRREDGEPDRQRVTEPVCGGAEWFVGVQDHCGDSEVYRTIVGCMV